MDPLVDEASGLIDDEKDKEQERELVHHVFIHNAVVHRLDADGSDEDESKVPAKSFALAKSHCAVEAACRGDLHGSVVG